MSITQLVDGNPGTCRAVVQHFPAFYFTGNPIARFILVSFLP